MTYPNFEFEDDWERDVAEEMDCNYGFEFCSNPEIKAMGLCTIVCEEYLESIKNY